MIEKLFRCQTPKIKFFRIKTYRVGENFSYVIFKLHAEVARWWIFEYSQSPGILDRNFSFRARSENRRGFKIPGIGSGICDPQKSRIPGMELWNFWARKSPSKIPHLGDGYLRFFKSGVFSSRGFFFVGWDIPPKSHLWLHVF